MHREVQKVSILFPYLFSYSRSMDAFRRKTTGAIFNGKKKKATFAVIIFAISQR